jgi:hypothetical protein
MFSSLVQDLNLGFGEQEVVAGEEMRRLRNPFCLLFVVFALCEEQRRQWLAFRASSSFRWICKRSKWCVPISPCLSLLVFSSCFFRCVISDLPVSLLAKKVYISSRFCGSPVRC